MKDSKIIEFLYLFSSMFMIGLLIFILFFSLKYWTINYPNLRSISDQAFYIAIGIAIVTSIAQWIEGRIKATIESINVLTKRRRKNAKESK